MGAFLFAVAGLAGVARADEDVADRLKALEERVRAQDEELRVLREKVGEPDAVPDGLQAEIDSYLAKDGAPEGWFGEAGTFRAFWKEGLNFETADKAFTLKIGGRIMLDLSFPDADDDFEEAYDDEFDDMYEFRRARLELEGGLYGGSVFYRFQVEFAGQEVSYRDMYIGFDLGFLDLIAGTQFEPFGLEETTSSKYMTFMEKSFVFQPSRNTGFQVRKTFLDDSIVAAFGIFFEDDDAIGRLEHNFTGRISWAPLNEDKGEKVVHLGLAASHRSPEDGEFRFRARPEFRITPRLIDTGTLPVDDYVLLGLEAAAVFGPFSVQGEFVLADVNGGDDPSFSAWYVYASWFVTGEHRPYKAGTFGRVRPKSNFLGGDGGVGAWELALRYARIDLDDGDVQGGEMSTITFGVNWYLNPNTRIMLNYVYADVDHLIDDAMSALMLRFQLDF